MLAMFRICWDALSSRAREIAGVDLRVGGMALIRSSAPKRRPVTRSRCRAAGTC